MRSCRGSCYRMAGDDWAGSSGSCFYRVSGSQRWDVELLLRNGSRLLGGELPQLDEELLQLNDSRQWAELGLPQRNGFRQ